MTALKPQPAFTAQELFDLVTALDTALVNRNKRIKHIENDYPDRHLSTEAYTTRKKRLAAVTQSFEQEWTSLLRTLDTLCKEVRSVQPLFDNLQKQHINTAAVYPKAIAVNRMHIRYENFEAPVPRLLPFPIPKALIFTEEEHNEAIIHCILLRLIQTMPIGKLHITVADPLNLGNSLKPFLTLLNLNRLFPDQRCLTYSDEIEKVLADLENVTEKRLQDTFKEDIADWNTYNEKHPDNPLPYHLLLLFGVPEQLTDKSLWFLSKLIEYGPVCGILPIITMNEKQLEGEREHKCQKLRQSINQHGKKMSGIAAVLQNTIKELSITEEPDALPGQRTLHIFFRTVSEMYEQHGSFSKTIRDIVNIHECWNGNAEDILNIPIGWEKDGTPVYFALGGVHTPHHALLAGKSGSGKSNILHVLIQSLCHTYSPSELSLYLLDYKQGVEFNVYAEPPLPHAKLVATESDPEYGVTVLEYLRNELNRRSKLFKDSNINSYAEFRQNTREELPRILLIIDEFQMLFTEKTAVQGDAEKFLSELLRQGRSYGIHILLATQTLRGISAASMGQLTSQIGCRIALSCQEEDSSMLLSSGNTAAASLNSPPEGIINTENGIKSGNKIFLIPEAQKDFCRERIKTLNALAFTKGYCPAPRIFEGAKMPPLPGKSWFASRNTQNQKVHLYVGTRLRFEEDPLAICLEKRPGFNLLIAGYNHVFHDGILVSILHSLHTGCTDTILYFDGRLFETGSNAAVDSYQLPVSHYTKAADLKLEALADKVLHTRTILIIDGLESVKEFHDSGTVGIGKAQDATSPLALLKKILEQGPANGSFVIAFTDRWKQCAASCKGLMSFFEMRIGFCLNEDDAGLLSNGSISKLKGLEKDNRAVFIDRLRQQSAWFRPYVLSEEQQV